MFDLNGKVAVVTGASSGLGADGAIALAKQGASVAILARRKEKLDTVKNEIENIGRKCIAIECDVTSEDSIKNAINSIISEFGKIDILYNNAGIAVRGGVDSLSMEDWNKSFDTNVKSIYLMCKYIVPHMISQNYGKIINTASINAVICDKNDMFIRHSYNASKSAVLGLTKAMAASYGKNNITVNAIGPALFETEMTANTLFKSDEFLQKYSAVVPLCRPGKKNELSGTVVYLASDASSYVTGQLILVDGGYSIV